jgi:hypothetical protein
MAGPQSRNEELLKDLFSDKDSISISVEEQLNLTLWTRLKQEEDFPVSEVYIVLINLLIPGQNCWTTLNIIYYLFVLKL